MNINLKTLAPNLMALRPLLTNGLYETCAIKTEVELTIDLIAKYKSDAFIINFWHPLVTFNPWNLHDE